MHDLLQRPAPHGRLPVDTLSAGAMTANDEILYTCAGLLLALFMTLAYLLWRGE